MKQILILTSLTLVLLSQTACKRNTETATTASTPGAVNASATPAAATAGPMAGVVPHDDAKTAAESSATGPAEASTAIGGVVSNQEKGGSETRSAPQATGGDGAAKK
jgi:hypothetical protein